MDVCLEYFFHKLLFFSCSVGFILYDTEQQYISHQMKHQPITGHNFSAIAGDATETKSVAKSDDGVYRPINTADICCCFGSRI